MFLVVRPLVWWTMAPCCLQLQRCHQCLHKSVASGLADESDVSSSPSFVVICYSAAVSAREKTSERTDVISYNAAVLKSAFARNGSEVAVSLGELDPQTSSATALPAALARNNVTDASPAPAIHCDGMPPPDLANCDGMRWNAFGKCWQYSCRRLDERWRVDQRTHRAHWRLFFGRWRLQILKRTL